MNQLITLTVLFITSLTHTRAADTPWKTLFDGKSLDGWKPTSEANWRVEDGTITVDSGQRGFLIHEDTYTNYQLTLEFKAAKGTNSGVFLNTKIKPADVATDCYELNIAPPDNPFPTGSLVGRKKYPDAGETDTWRKFDITVNNGLVSVQLDGQQILDYHSDPPSTGNLLGLQLNGGRVAFRNIKTREISDNGFDQTLSLQGLSFHLTCPNNSSINTLIISSNGLAGGDSTVTCEVDGTVTGAEIADLNGDGSPEIYAFASSAGSGGYGSLIAYSSNNNKSISPIYLPDLADDKKNSKGYMGHDGFAVVETILARRFPIYNPGDSNAKPTGGTRQLQYKLVAGEAGWILKLDRSTDF